MKILIMHLLRLGDVIALSPVIKGFTDKHPDAQIHLLINREARAIETLLPSQIKVKVFDRDAVQDGLGNAEIPTSFSVNYIDNLVREVNSEKYDLIANFTQNKFSAKLLSQFSATEKIGMEIDANGKVRFNSQWFEYLNSPHSQSASRLHYTDVFRRAIRVHDRFPSIGLRTTPQGELEAEPIISRQRDVVCIQATSSEEKKCWTPRSLAIYIQRASSLLSETDFVVLCAPNELAELKKWKEKYLLDVTIFPCSIPAAFSILKRAKLLVTPDTSIKHLAAVADTPTIELSLGSSDSRVLGSYRNGSLVLQSKVHCAPCGHATDCHREKRFCETDIDPELVALMTTPYIQSDHESIRSLARTHSQRVDVFLTEIDGSASWSLTSLSEDTKETSNYFEKLSWRLHLDFKNKQLTEVGSEAITFTDYVSKRSVSTEEVEELKEVRFQLQGIVDEWMQKSSKLLTADIDGKQVEEFNQELLEQVESLGERAEYYRTELARDLQSRTPFLYLKNTRNRLRSVKERLSIENKVLEMTLKRIEEKHEKEC